MLALELGGAQPGASSLPPEQWRLPPSCFAVPSRVAKRLPNTAKREPWPAEALAYARRATRRGRLDEAYRLAEMVFAQQVATHSPATVAAAVAAISSYL